MESGRVTVPEVIEAMGWPDFYSERPPRVELKQTHISYVFLAGDRVYKIKKPVSFAFLDFSTLASRYHYCLEEVRLNRRLAPDIYLGVLPIFREGGHFALGHEVFAMDPRAVEYVVQMRRLPEEKMLDRLLGSGSVGIETIKAIARRLEQFHSAASSDRASEYGTARAVRQLVMENLLECSGLVGYTLTQEQFSTIERFIETFTRTNRDLMDQRARNGRIREGHGDLRCEHICLSNGIEIFDCVEFSEQLRYGDVASEIAFLAMDLDRLEQRLLADALVEASSSLNNDDDFATVVPFYKCYRAIVRGKVESLASLEAEIDEGRREHARRRAAACFDLASHYARLGTPVLIVVCGLSGTGKSTVAQMIRNRLGFGILSSDRIRKRLAKIPETASARADYAQGIYSDAFTRLTYETIVSEAEKTLRSGRGVVLDATFRLIGDRCRVSEMAARAKAPVLFVECIAEESDVLRRLRSRQNKPGEVSDATAEVYQRQRGEFAPLDEIVERSRVAVHTDQSEDTITEKIESALTSVLA